MSYELILKDSQDEQHFALLDVPIIRKDIEGASDTTTLDGNIYTDYLYLKTQYEQSFSWLFSDDYEKLRGFYTRQFESGEYPTYTLLDHTNTIPTPVERQASASGNPIEITDGKKVDIFSLKGDTKQGASPNPEYPQEVQTVSGTQEVVVCGKNILPIVIGTNYGVSATYDKSSGDISISGTATGAYPSLTSNISLDRTYTSGTTLTLSVDSLPTGISTIYVRLYKSDGTYGNYALNSSTLKRTFTLEYDTNKAMIVFGTTSGTAVSGTFRLQLEEGSTATDFEPYRGGKYEINLGKNIFDKDNANIISGYFTASGTYAGVGGVNRIIYIKCEANTTYTITKPAQATLSNNRFRIGTSDHIIAEGDTINDFWKDTDGTTNTTHTITTGGVAKYLYIFIGSATDNTMPGGEIQDILDGIQIERGSVATTYAPYFEPVELCKLGDYQDKIVKVGDTWKIERQVGKYTFTGAEGWIRSGNTTTTMFVGALANDNLISHIDIEFNNDIRALTEINKFTLMEKIPGATLKTDVCCSIYNNRNGSFSALALSLPISTTADLTAFTNWLSANDVCVYSVKRTPTTETITNEALIAQLNAVSQAQLSLGYNRIANSSANLAGDIELDYTWVDTEYLPTTLIDNQPVRLKLTDGGIIDSCGTRQNIKLVMRETEEQ